MENLIDKELVSDKEVEEPLSPVVNSSVVELKCLELQDWEHELEANVKLCELELREKELSLQLELKELENSTVISTSSPARTTATFDISKHIRFIPPFQEKELDTL